MKKQKHGFWVFIFSLIPGAGEMYMGFKKQGISIMLLFWGAIALASITGLGWLAMFLPVIWFYSFFNVHNLKSLSEEEFYSVDDNYILHMDQFSGDIGKFLQKHRNTTAWILILFGICGVVSQVFCTSLYRMIWKTMYTISATVFLRSPLLSVSLLQVFICSLNKKRNWRKKKIKMSIIGNRTVHISK